MKTKQTLLLTIALMISIVGADCQQFQQLTKPKPVVIDGLGSLSDLKNKELKPTDLVKVVKSLIEQTRINETDAGALLTIYERNITSFADAARQSDNDERLDKADVEEYLQLLLPHTNLSQEAERATWREASERMQESAFGTGSDGLQAGGFIGVYLNAYNNSVAKDDEDLRDKKYDDGQGASQIAVLTAYESAAQKITSGERTATPEQKAAATKFLANLRTYDNELDASEKILNANGRLIDASQASINQKGNMEGTVVVSTNSKMGDRAKAKAAAEAMSGEMKGAYESLRQGITDNLKRR